MNSISYISKITVAAAVAVIGIATQNSAFAGDGTGSISGTVTEAVSGIPIQGIQVSVIAPVKKDLAEIAYGALTDEKGQFTIPGIRAGAYTVTVIGRGYKPEVKTPYNVGHDQTLQLNSSLAPY